MEIRYVLSLWSSIPLQIALKLTSYVCDIYPFTYIKNIPCITQCNGPEKKIILLKYEIPCLNILYIQIKIYLLSILHISLQIQ